LDYGALSRSWVLLVNRAGALIPHVCDNAVFYVPHALRDHAADGALPEKFRATLRVSEAKILVW
jgi:hypothetical protein